MRWHALLLSHLVAAVAVCSKYKLFVKISFLTNHDDNDCKKLFLTNHDNDDDDDGKKQNLDPLVHSHAGKNSQILADLPINC